MANLGGMQALFPVYLARMATDADARDEYDSAIAQNENNLNQNFELLYRRLLELEAVIKEGTGGNT